MPFGRGRYTAHGHLAQRETASGLPPYRPKIAGFSKWWRKNTRRRFLKKGLGLAAQMQEQIERNRLAAIAKRIALQNVRSGVWKPRLPLRLHKRLTLKRPYPKLIPKHKMKYVQSGSIRRPAVTHYYAPR